MERSNSYDRCIYTSPAGLCLGQSPLHPNEHYLPAGLGSFKDDIHLRNFICYECQGRFSKFETVFLQNSSEAFFRKILGFRGRRKHKDKNIFVEPTLGLPPLTVKGLHPTLQHEVLWEMTSQGKALLMRQLVFKKNDGSLEHVPIRLGRLSQDLARFGEEWKSWQLLACFAGVDEESEVQAIFGSQMDGMKTAPTDVPEQVELQGEMRAQITLPYVQAISKIALHFVLARFQFTGFEPEFEDLKRFIYLGIGENPARPVEEPLLPQLIPDEARLRHWSHILTAELNSESLVARMQFFVGPSLKPFTWRVDLGENPSRALSHLAKGFCFFYYESPDQSGYIGGIEKLRLGPKMLASH